MDTVFNYFRLLQFEFAEMTTQLDAELAALLAVLTVVVGWYWLRGSGIKS